MQMTTRREGDFTTNLSVVVQISERQDLRPVSSNATTPLTFACESYIETTFLFFNDYLYYDRIASEGEGCKPSSDRQKNIVESEFALLGILSETMSNNIFLCRLQWTTGMQAGIINV